MPEVPKAQGLAAPACSGCLFCRASMLIAPSLYKSQDPTHNKCPDDAEKSRIKQSRER
jgi:hypothetical protein